MLHISKRVLRNHFLHNINLVYTFQSFVGHCIFLAYNRAIGKFVHQNTGMVFGEDRFQMQDVC
jgi:hypothetical protein